MFGAHLSSELTWGKCTVNFPVRFHQKGELLTANWWEPADPDRFYLIEARDLNDAIQVASRIPSARSGAIEVRPIVERTQA